MGKKTEVKTYDHSFPVEFSTVGIGAEKVRIGVRCSRKEVEPDVAEELFCGAQIEVELDCDPNSKGDVDGQQTIEGTTIKLAGVATVARYGVNPDEYMASLQFPKSSVALDQLGAFSSQKGVMRATKIGETGADEDADDDASDE